MASLHWKPMNIIAAPSVLEKWLKPIRIRETIGFAVATAKVVK
jgi:hypothetical protein